MIRCKIAILALLTLPFIVSAQNVGQEGDTKLNYTDINGLKQGQWIKKYSNGNIQYEAYFIDNKPIGEFKRYDSYGNLYAMLTYDSLGITADATFYHRSGKICATGKYYEHERDSIWLYYSDGGTLYLQESYKRGVKDGLFIQYTSEHNKLDETNWKDGEKHGTWKRYYPSGPLKFQCNYDHGKLDGEGLVYHPNGVLYKKGKYVNDLMEGSWLIFDTNGKYEKQYVYKHGYCEKLAEEQNREINELESHKGEIEGPEEFMDDPIKWLMKRD